VLDIYFAVEGVLAFGAVSGVVLGLVPGIDSFFTFGSVLVLFLVLFLVLIEIRF
jgi:hypothetical protein